MIRSRTPSIQGVLAALVLLTLLPSCRTTTWPRRPFTGEREPVIECFIREVESAYSGRQDGKLYPPAVKASRVIFHFVFHDSGTGPLSEQIRLNFDKQSSVTRGPGDDLLNERTYQEFFEVMVFQPRAGPDLMLSEEANALAEKIAACLTE